MKLHFLGTSGYFANDHRHTACLMLPEVGVVLDAGSGLYRVADLIETAKLQIFVTHAHLDHVLGLTQLLEVLRRQPELGITVYAAPDKLRTIEEHLFDRLLFPKRPQFEAAALDEQPMSLARDGQLQSVPMKHPGGSLGFRLDWPGRSMAYITDTTADVRADYVSLIRGVDLLVHECYFADGMEDRAEQTGHSCLGQVAEVAQAAGARRVVLGHINPTDPHARQLDLNPWRSTGLDITIAHDGMVIEF